MKLKDSRTARVSHIRTFLINVIVAFVTLALIQTFVVRLYYVPSGSMEPTLEIGDRILVSKVAYVGVDPAPGDIVVFRPSSAWETQRGTESNALVRTLKRLSGLVGIGPTDDRTLVKRVIAGPGQTVECCGQNGELIVDGTAIDELYVARDFPFISGELDCESTPRSKRCVEPFRVPEEEYVVLGDNRKASSDSLTACRGAPELEACVRLVRRSDIVGKVWIIVHPMNRIGPPHRPEASIAPTVTQESTLRGPWKTM